jgi:transposase
MVWTTPAPASGSKASRAKMVVVEANPSEGAPSVRKSITDFSSVTTVGLDLAKHVFQVHCTDASGHVVFNKPVRRNKLLGFFASLPRSIVGLEACGSAHHWARELIKLGHNARMMPPAYVKPYIRRQKNDAADAAAICEAATRPSMRFVAVRSLENQAALMRHKAREMLVSQRTQLWNGLRGHLAEVGVIAPQGPRHARELAELVEACDETIPIEVCEALAPRVVQLRNLDEALARLERTIAKLAQQDETARRLMSIPGFGPITASAMAASVQDVSSFAGPREFAAFLGLTPKQSSSGGKQRLGRISKMGNRELRKLLVVGAHAVLFHRRSHTDPLRMWAKTLIEKKPFKLVAVALANKMARIAFAILRDKTVYRRLPA